MILPTLRAHNKPLETPAATTTNNNTTNNNNNNNRKYKYKKHII